MIRPEKDPHWLLGVEHGREGREPYRFGDTEHQRRYLAGYEHGRIPTEAPTFFGWRRAHHEPSDGPPDKLPFGRRGLRAP